MRLKRGVKFRLARLKKVANPHNFEIGGQFYGLYNASISIWKMSDLDENLRFSKNSTNVGQRKSLVILIPEGRDVIFI